MIYAREHGNEHDTSHVAEGAIRFLVSDDLEAAQARADFCFLIIPMLDPDGAFGGKYANITDRFFWGNETPETLAYAAWFKTWMDSGKRLDVALNLHNFVSTKGTHVECPMMEPPTARLKACQDFHQHVIRDLKAEGFVVASASWEQSFARFRLGGWLQKYFATLHMPYEVNSQSSSKRMTINDLRTIGAGLARSATAFLDSEMGKTVADEITKAQTRRLELWSQERARLAGRQALEAEERCRKAGILSKN